MKTYASVFLLLICGSMLADDQHLSPRFRTVYILGMSDSLDQYLANRLTIGRVLWVVLDPSNADAVITDNLDEPFWNWLGRSYPPVTAASADRGSTYRASTLPPAKQRGTIFLVDPHRRLVLWSTYELPKNSSPTELDHSAERISSQLKTAFGKR